MIKLRLHVVVWALVGAGLWSRAAHAESDTFGLGTGRDGDFAPVASTSINVYAAVTATAAAGTRVVTVDATTGFAAGQVVLLWQTTGVGMTTVGDQTTIDLATTGVGHYEWARIDSVTAGTLTLTNDIVSAAGFGAGAQVIRVPEYANVTIAAGVTISPGQPWDGSKGGVVAFLATGTVTVDGTISADATGFRGGVIVNHNSLDNCGADLATLNTPNAGYQMKGEGLVPSLYSAAPTGTTALGGRGNATSGGGGGVCHNSGGGGGGHRGRGGRGGDTWDGDPTPAGDSIGRPYGGLGGASVTYDPMARLTFGGGGGAGDQNNNVGISGGRGGGVVLVRAGALAGAGALTANGQTPTRPGGAVADNDGAGGGGGGGAVIVLLTGDAACGSLAARGGDGGSTVTGNRHGTGGGGAGGLVFLRAASGSCTGTAAPGAAGTWRPTPSSMTADTWNAGPTVAGDVTLATGVADVQTSTPYTGGTCTPAVLGGNQCGGCLASSECPGDKPVCNTTSHACVVCTGDFGGGAGSCPSNALPFCVPNGPRAGSCAQCVSDGNCAGNLNGTLCDPDKLTCGTCTGANATACPLTAPFCDTAAANNLCAACNGDAGSNATRACGPATPACVGAGPLAGACVECQNNGHCAGNPNGAVCDPADAACGPCAPGNLGSCTGNAAFCHTAPARNICIGCNGNFASGALFACPSAMQPSCATSGVNAGACVQCVNDGTCGGNAPVCNVATNVCGGCNGNAGSGASFACPMAFPYCDSQSGLCLGSCLRDADCGPGNFCNDIGQLGACEPRRPNGVAVPGGACSGPVATRACASGICDSADNLCGLPSGGGTCSATAQCRTGVCVANGANAGKCLGCNMDNDCGPSTPVCNPTSNLCVACSLTTIGACAGTTPVCDAGSSTCVPCNGDRGSVATGACPNVAAPHCAQDGSCGRCLTNADCTVGSHAGPICNTDTGVCGTGCTVDTDCAGTQWCDNPTTAAAAGVCAPKVPNDQPLPAGAPVNGVCSDANGTRVCLSGVCEDGDDRCGRANGGMCSGAGMCRSAVCAGDGVCGSPNGQGCTSATTCRAGVCGSDGLCGSPSGGACTSTAQCRAGMCMGGFCGGPFDGGMGGMGGDAGAADGGRTNPDAAVTDGGAGQGGVDAAADAVGAGRDGGTDALAMGGAGGTGGVGGTGGGAGQSETDGGIDPSFDFAGGGCNCNAGRDGRSGVGVLLAFVGLVLRGRRRRR